MTHLSHYSLTFWGMVCFEGKARYYGFTVKDSEKPLAVLVREAKGAFRVHQIWDRDHDGQVFCVIGSYGLRYRHNVYNILLAGGMPQGMASILPSPIQVNFTHTQASFNTMRYKGRAISCYYLKKHGPCKYLPKTLKSSCANDSRNCAIHDRSSPLQVPFTPSLLL